MVMCRQCHERKIGVRRAQEFLLTKNLLVDRGDLSFEGVPSTDRIPRWVKLAQGSFCLTLKSVLLKIILPSELKTYD